ncbi:MAG: hypothetical protein ABFD05_01305 [Anaerolineaceae bacterium]
MGVTLFNTRLCRVLPEHSLSPQASNPNLRPPFASRARCAHTRFKRWGASQDTGTIKDKLQFAVSLRSWQASITNRRPSVTSRAR